MTNPTGTLTLSDFLLARIAEDEAWARIEGDAYLRAHGPAALVDEPKTPALFSRVLAECEVKRRIVEMYREYEGVSEDEQDARWDGGDAGMAEALYRVCDGLAAIYADHPDYREEWKP